jgi:hypothetical protein
MIRSATPADLDRNILEFFGVAADGEFEWKDGRLRIGAESFALSDIRAAVREMHARYGIRDVRIDDLRPSTPSAAGQGCDPTA